MKGKRRPVPPWRRSTPFKGVAVAQTFRGQLHWQKWPRKRGPAKSQKLKRINQRFGTAQQLAKYADDWAIWMAHEIAKAGPIYPRDLHISAMYGRLFEIIQTDEGNWHSVAYRDDISYDLDVVAGSAIGTILVRTPTGWRGTTPGQSGTVLTSNGTDQAPTYQAAAGGGGIGWTQMSPDSGFNSDNHNTRGFLIKPLQDYKVSRLMIRVNPGAAAEVSPRIWEVNDSLVIQSLTADGGDQVPGAVGNIYLEYDLDPPAELVADTTYFFGLSNLNQGDTNGMPQGTANNTEGFPNLQFEPFAHGSNALMHARVTKTNPSAGDTVTAVSGLPIWFGLQVTS